MADANITATKACSKCRKRLPESDFYRQSGSKHLLQGKCKSCHKKYASAWRRARPEKVAASRQKEYRRDRHKRRLEGKAPRRNHPSNLSREGRLRLKWREQHARRLADPKMRAAMNIKSALRRTAQGKQRSSKWLDILGYSRAEFVEHIERQFLPGMSWDNYGDWHIDHIVPLSSFEINSASDPSLVRAWSLTNLRPLWAIDNLRKSNTRTHLI